MYSSILGLGRYLSRCVVVAGARIGYGVASACRFSAQTLKWSAATQKRRFLLAVVCAALFFHQGAKATELVPFSAPSCPGGVTISGATKYTNPSSGAKFVYVQTSAGQQTWAYEWNDDDGVMQWNKYGSQAPGVTRAHIAAMAIGWPSSYDLHSEFTVGVTPNYAFVACQAEATSVPDSCCGHFLCVNGGVVESSCVSPCTPYNSGCVFIPGFYAPPRWYACDGFGNCGEEGPPGGCAPYGGDGDGDGTCAQFDCCDSDANVGANPCPDCYLFCQQYTDSDGDGCCTNRDCDDSDPSVCSFCTPPPPGPCENEGGDADMDGCCGNVDYDDSDPEVCAPPEGCASQGGDGDMDGCCANNDYDDGDPEVCSEPEPGPCERLGGDGDMDGCCGDIDVDDGDPEVCLACENEGGDVDEDGCCDELDTHPNDPEKGCSCVVEGEQQDADGDGCCTADDSDDDDPEKGCKCECEVDPMERLDEIAEKVTAWWPPFDDLVEAASTGSFQSGAATGETVFSTTLHLPYAFGGTREIEVPLTLNPAEWPSGFAATFGWLVDYVRSALLVYFLTTFCFAILGLLGIL